MTMAYRFFKIVEITSDEYFNKTADYISRSCTQSVCPEDDGIYVATDAEYEDEVRVDLESFDYCKPLKDGDK